jgi:hypothetical protein
MHIYSTKPYKPDSSCYQHPVNYNILISNITVTPKPYNSSIYIINENAITTYYLIFLLSKKGFTNILCATPKTLILDNIKAADYVFIDIQETEIIKRLIDVYDINTIVITKTLTREKKEELYKMRVYRILYEPFSIYSIL